MLYCGLTSVTFRNLSPEKIIELVKISGLKGIEWGGDVHVLPGNYKNARNIRRKTEEAGLIPASYGSYFRVGENKPEEFDTIVQTALELGTPMIRIWAGGKGSHEADDMYFAKIVEETQLIAKMAERENLSLSFEFHSHTLTDTGKSAKKLLNQLRCENVFSYWQPTWQQPLGTLEYCLSSLQDILKWLSNVHVFHWGGSTDNMLPLEIGKENWIKYIDSIRKTPQNHWLFLEFVKDSDPDLFLRDANTLLRLTVEDRFL